GAGGRPQVGQGAWQVAGGPADRPPLQAQLGPALGAGPGQAGQGDGVVEDQGGGGQGLLVAQPPGGPLAGGDGPGGQAPVLGGGGADLAGQADRLDQVGGHHLGQAGLLAQGAGEPVGQPAVQLGPAGLGQHAVGDGAEP